MNTAHVIPLNDTRKHQLSAHCWCQPLNDDEFDVFIHNSADGREKFETGERKPS